MLARVLGTEKFTGWHMAAVIGLFFGTIIAVNITLAYFALKSWSGLVVPNSYIASQHFNEVTEEKRKQAALGWQSDVAYQDGLFALRLTDQYGNLIDDVTVNAVIGRPVSDAADQAVVLTRKADGNYAVETMLKSGVWDVAVSASRDDQITWEKTIRIHIEEK